VLKQFQPQYRL